jgi:hypothetical protein|tara:strand:+ start:157 stop:1281 length:1125 start_codon:yes stop_codon:yes gene_type:complete
MQLSPADATYAADKFIDYFSNTGRIDEYLRTVKLDRIADQPMALPGFGPEDDLFSDFDMSPEDMDIKIYNAGDKGGFSNEYFNERLQITMSHAFESSIPGKSLKWIVKEGKTDKTIGFIRFGSPTINSRPRNEWLGNTPELGRFNRHAIMGFIIVPTQPFGFNYLGGKLLAMLCCSHEAREQLNKKYNTNICLFETTSLYGSTKSSSQYDGLKPYMRYKGLTDSDFTPLLHDSIFQDLNKWFIARNGDKMLVKEDASSRKLKTQSKMISIIKKSLDSSDKLKQFASAIVDAKNLTEQKRFYMSTYGFKNAREVILGTEDTLVKAENYDRFSIDSIVDWWRRKASRRYESLQNLGRLRTKLETWNTNPDEIDIIR